MPELVVQTLNDTLAKQAHEDTMHKPLVVVISILLILTAQS